MKFPWFKRTGPLFIPRNFPGWIMFLIALICAVYRFKVIDSVSHSASDTLRPFFINLIIIFAAYSLVGFLTSPETKNK